MKFDHILSRHGVLTKFNIAKKIKSCDMLKIRKELKKTCNNADEVEEKLKQMVLLRMRDTSHFEKIPGLIVNGKEALITRTKAKVDPFKSIPIKIKQKIVSIAMNTNKILKQEKFNKELILMFLQILLMKNQISNDDITAFNEKYKFRSDD